MTSLPGTYVTNIEIKTKSIEKADKHSTDNKYIWQEYIFMFWITNKNEIRDNVFIYLLYELSWKWLPPFQYSNNILFWPSS